MAGYAARLEGIPNRRVVPAIAEGEYTLKDRLLFVTVLATIFVLTQLWAAGVFLGMIAKLFM